MRKGAVILCGGKSSRMGRNKATLPFGAELMLQRVVRLIGRSVGSANIVVVAAAGQALPELPHEIRIAYDARESRGPLEGLATGLRALDGRADAVFASACDVPLLVPAFADRMFELLEDFDVVVPIEGRHYHPLAAVYRQSVLPRIQELLEADRLSIKLLFHDVRTREIPVDELRAIDPQLSTLSNLNFEADYLAALAAAGLKK